MDRAPAIEIELNLKVNDAVVLGILRIFKSEHEADVRVTSIENGLFVGNLLTFSYSGLEASLETELGLPAEKIKVSGELVDSKTLAGRWSRSGTAKAPGGLKWEVIKVVEKSGHPDFPPVRSHRAQLRQWAQDRVVHFSEREAILFTYVTAIH